MRARTRDAREMALLVEAGDGFREGRAVPSRSSRPERPGHTRSPAPSPASPRCRQGRTSSWIATTRRSLRGSGSPSRSASTAISVHGDLVVFDAGRKGAGSDLLPPASPTATGRLAFIHEEHRVPVPGWLAVPGRRPRGTRSGLRADDREPLRQHSTSWRTAGSSTLVGARPPRRRVTTELRGGAQLRRSKARTSSTSVGVRWTSRAGSRSRCATEWGTVPPTVRSSSVEQTQAFRVVEAGHENDDVAFGWHGVVEATTGELHSCSRRPSGRSDTAGSGSACCTRGGPTSERPTARPMAQGSRRERSRRDHAADARRRRYQAMIESFSVLDVGFPSGVSAAFSLEGERFELEDQRNWTDASFKTYPTPLEKSEPRTLGEGTEVAQAMTLRLSGRAPASRVVDDVTVVQLGDPTGWTMPPIGLVAPGDRTLGPAHLRLDIEVAEGDDGVLRRGAALGCPLEVALLIDDEASGLDAIAPSLSSLPLARVLVHLTSGVTIPGALVREVRARLGRGPPVFPSSVGHRHTSPN